MVRKAPVITKIEVTEFEYTLQNIGAEGTINIPVYKKGSSISPRARVVRIFTDQGVTGEYVGGSATEHSAIPMFAKAAVGRSALDREKIYNDAKQALRQHARMGMSQVDMALWDLAGKWFDAPIYELLGVQRLKFPAYASTYCGDHQRLTRTLPNSVTKSATRPSRSTRGKTPRSTNTSASSKRSASGSVTRWTCCSTRSAPSLLLVTRSSWAGHVTPGDTTGGRTP